MKHLMQINNSMSEKKCIIAVFVFFVLAYSSFADEIRTFVGNNSKEIKAEFVSFDKENQIVHLRLIGGKDQKVKLSLFSAKDREWILNGGKTGDNPFGDNVASDKSNDGKIVRVSLNISSEGNCEIELKKASEPPQNDFVGRKIKQSLFPSTDIKVNDEGLTSFSTTFTGEKDSFLWNQRQPIHVDPDKKMLMIQPPDNESGTTSIGFGSGVFQFPLIIACDIVEFDQEVFNSEFIFDGTKEIFTCLVTSKGGINGPYTLQCRWGEGGTEKVYRSLLLKKNISLDKPERFQCKLPIPEGEMRCSIGTNLNVGTGEPVNRSSIGISHLEFTGMFLPMRIANMNGDLYCPTLAARLRTDGNNVSFRGSSTKCNKLGIMEGDVVHSINGIRCRSANSFREIMSGITLAEPFVLEVKRDAETKKITIFE